MPFKFENTNLEAIKTASLYSASRKYSQCFTFPTFCYVTAAFQNAGFIFPSILKTLPVPAAEKHPYSMITTRNVGMVFTRWWAVPGFLHTWCLPFRPKSSICVSSTEEWLPLSTETRWSSVRVTIVFLVTTLTKTLLPQIAQFGWAASSG